MESPGAPAGGGGTISDVLQSALPGILKRGKIITSPYPFGLSDDDNLRVTAVNSVAGVTVNIHTRRVLRDLSVTADTPSFAPPADRTPTSIDVPLAGGYTTNLSVFASGAAVRKGQCFVIVQMIRGLGLSATILGTLLAGSITQTQAIGWPGSPIESSTDGEPVVRMIVGTDPAVGLDIVETVPTGARWELISLVADGVFSATASAIVPRLTIESGGSVYAAAELGIYGAGTYTNNTRFAFGAGYSPFGYAGSFTTAGSLPSGLRMLAGTIIRVPGLPNCNFDAPHYIVREWQEAG